MTAAPNQNEQAPADLWNEDGDVVMLRADQYASASKARYAAFSGHDLPIPVGDGVLTDLRVRVIHMRPSESDEDTWSDDMWWECEKTHPNAVRYYEVSLP